MGKTHEKTKKKQKIGRFLEETLRNPSENKKKPKKPKISRASGSGLWAGQDFDENFDFFDFF